MADYEDEQAYEDDLAAQNAVEDAKYDAMMPEQDEPPEGYYDEPTHYQLAEDGINALDNVEFGTGQLSEEIALIQAHATLAMADQLADVLSLLKQERGKKSFAERVADEAMARLDRIDGRGTAFPIGVGSVSPTDPVELGEWLRDCPNGTIFQGAKGLGWQLNVVAVTSFLVAPYTYRAMTSTAGEEFRFDEGHVDLPKLVVAAPFTVLALGEVATQGDDNDG